MPTKQIKITFQATPAAGPDVNLSISVDGVNKFNQSVPASGPTVQGIPDPNESIEFDLEVATATANAQVEDHAFSITATNGRAKIETINANFSIGRAGNAVSAGDANTFRISNIVTQPLWNGQADLNRYDIAFNNGPVQVTGPGEVLIQAGETVTFTVAVPGYNDNLPVPN